MYNPDKLEEYAQKIYARYEYFNNYTLETIANRIKKTGELSAYDRQALKNIADITGDMDVITKKLAQITRMNIADIENVYKQVVTDGVNTYKPLYDFKGIKFVPFEQNEYAQQLVRHWAKETAGTMVNLSRTKALCFDKTDARGNVVGSVPLKGAYEQAIAEAVTAVTSGTTEFNTAMARTVERLGGSGVKVTYGSGVNRSLPAMMRQNLLYGAKQAAQSYDEYIGQELGCDGFEVDAHSGCRPTHMFMQGKMYSYNGRKVINGVAYEDGAEALDRLHDYGCLHFKTDVILGVSVPRYSKAELERIHRETTELIEYGGREKTLYEWKQTQRALERGVRNEQQKADVFDAAGMKRRAQNCRDRVKAYRDKYEDMCKNVKGIEPRLDRMRTYKAKANVDISGGSDIIKAKGVKKVQSGAFYGALNPENEKDFERCETHAKKYYDEIRNRKSDVSAVAKNTGFSEDTIRTVKEHIFINKYDLGEEEPTGFYPNYDIAVSWQNLIDGKNISEKDIILLKHEYYEYMLMHEKGMSYVEAHTIAQGEYNYKKAVDEWREKK